MATTISYGQCEKCGRSNPKTINECRACGKPLPWVKAPKPAKPAKSQAANRSAKQKSVAFDPLFWVIGLFIFAISFGAPFFGYAMSRYFDNDESDLAGFATTGMFLGVIVWALGFVSVMAKVGHTPS